MKYFLALAGFFLCVCSSAYAQLPADFDQTVIQNMEKWHAPGLGLAIVKDGETVLAKGYGVKSLSTMDPVNENTLFQAGSTTKAFAAMSIAILIDQGKMSWDDPIIKHIPEFRMKDEYVQNNLTIRDALSHSSGVGQISNINMFIGKNIDETWALMAEVPQTVSFRKRWEYNNTTFALPGRVIERITGVKFHQFVEDNILTPLGMNDTHLTDDEVFTDPNRVSAYQHYEGVDYEIDYPLIEYTQSAGMLNSTPEDMTKWMKFLLAKGNWNGEQLVAPEHIEEMMKPQMLLAPVDIYPAATSYDHSYYSYGLAWFVHDFRGYKMAMHTGSIGGAVAIIGLIPEENIGVYVFINSDHIEYRHALMYQVLDHLLGHSDTDWSNMIYPIYHPDEEPGEEAAEIYPDINPADLVGRYHLQGSYPLTILEQEGALSARVGIHAYSVEKQDDRYRVTDPATSHIPWENFLEIDRDTSGIISSVTLNGLTYERE